MTETESLKQFIPILGRISTPGERAIITRKILERIAGQQTSIMGVSHKQAGALAWPNDPVKALKFECALDKAVDAGEFVSFIHRSDRRHFQIEELSAWPNCPRVATESPLRYWLPFKDEAQPQAAPAAPATDTQPQAAPVETPEQRRARWLDWHGKGEHGALQRVHERELLVNPKADRSYIGKQIKVARAERGEQETKKKSGLWASQMVTGGKKKG